MELKNTAVIITGGASGMGAATAKWLSKLALTGIAGFKYRRSKTHCCGDSGLAISCDVTNAESVAAAIQTASIAHGPARVCINCAGVVQARRMVNQQGPIPLDEFRHIIDINLIGTFNVMRLAAHAMIPLPPIGESGERGVIINTASIAAFEGQIGQAAYSASKGGIVSLTLPVARELAQFAIRVMAIAPGLVDTPMFTKLSPEARASLTETIPFPKRLAHPEEYAMLVQQVIENSMLNGEVIRLDGALRMPPK